MFARNQIKRIQPVIVSHEVFGENPVLMKYITVNECEVSHFSYLRDNYC
jgi:hypothetical protein